MDETKTKIQLKKAHNRLLKVHTRSVATRLLRRQVLAGRFGPLALTLLDALLKTEVSTLRDRFRNSQNLKNQVYARDGIQCAIKNCRGKNLGIDHILPISKYPERAFSLSNLRVLCQRHNKG